MKIKLVIILLVILSQSICYVGQDKCVCEVLIASDGFFNVFTEKSTESEVLYEIHNDTISENYFTLSVDKIENNWAFISAYSPNKEFKESGWIQISRIGIFTSEYPILFKKPDMQSKNEKIKDYDWDYLKILDCKGKWLKVQFKDNIGWLPPNNQCSNPYTHVINQKDIKNSILKFTVRRDDVRTTNK